MSVTNALPDGADEVTLYNRNAVAPSDQRAKSKMAALSSEQYFEQKTATQSTADILGMGSDRKRTIDDIEAPFPRKKPPQTQSAEDDDFEDWGFEPDDGSHDKKEKGPDPSATTTAAATRCGSTMWSAHPAPTPAASGTP